LCRPSPDRNSTGRVKPGWYRRLIDRRPVVLAAFTVLIAYVVVLGITSGGDDGPADTVTIAADAADAETAGGVTSAPVVAAPATTQATTTTSSTVPLAVDDGKTSSERRLIEAFTASDDDLQPKSVVASGNGLFFAQNMMYRHNVAVFDRSGAEVGVIDDTVNLGDFGFEPVTVQGSPVEAAFTPDGRYVYVSNYKMYGDGYNPVADDNCDRGDWDDSFVYKIDVETLEIVAVVPTGAVPKFLQVSPDGSTLVVSNWCGFDVSFIDTATDTELGRVDVGRHPRGVAIDSGNEVAYVTVMGEHRIDVIGLQSRQVLRSFGTEVAGTTPRHIVLSPDDRYLYVSNNQMDSVRKIDLSSGAVLGEAFTGTATRTMAISDDGESLYVVNYEDGTVSKVRTNDMEILQTVYSGYHPVGITYDADTRQVWVANYAGSLSVFTDA
jgi:YVTN family beta-propeller protein